MRICWRVSGKWVKDTGGWQWDHGASVSRRELPEAKCMDAHELDHGRRGDGEGSIVE
jgi:hypothetical protein